MRAQLKRPGLGYDWEREIATCLPSTTAGTNGSSSACSSAGSRSGPGASSTGARRAARSWRTSRSTTARCWRCDNPVVRREFEQWFLKITDYAQELLDGLDGLPDWPERVRTMQRNWIGRSEGAKVLFAVDGLDADRGVHDAHRHRSTARPTSRSPSSIRSLALAAGTPQENAVAAFVAAQTATLGRGPIRGRGREARRASPGGTPINPFSGEKIPIWAANFVLHDVGTGAIMSVPAHDARDFAFAKKYGLTIRPVIRPVDGEAAATAAKTARSRTTASSTRSGRTTDSGRRGRARAHGRRRRQPAGSDRRRSPIGSRTGACRASATGRRRSPSSTARPAGSSPCPTPSFRCSSRTTRP